MEEGRAAFPQGPGILWAGGVRLEERFALGLRQTEGRGKTVALERGTNENRGHGRKSEVGGLTKDNRLQMTEG
jgi:hypothetical protein